jgi:16S rRNA (uracil1498-N3)-methyltransferase
MKQFILTKEPDFPQGGGDGIVRLEGNDYHYLVNVRRLATGEFFPALLPDGKETLVQVLSIERGVLTGKCNTGRFDKLSGHTGEGVAESPSHGQENNLPPLVLFQAIPKGDKMDLIVRQAAEGGITEIVPFVSEFSTAKIAAEKGQKFLRWERIIKEARQQSGSMIATALHQPLTKNELFDYWKKLCEKNVSGSLGLLFHHQKGLENKSLHGYLNSNPQVLAFAIGPEGGFSEKEVALFMENGFKPLTIGDTVLRTETAALYCAAAIRILLLEKDSWKLKQANSGSE